MTRASKTRNTAALLVALGLGGLTLAACSDGSMSGGAPVGSEAWLEGGHSTANDDQGLSREEVNDAFTAADTNGDGQLSAGERSGHGGR